MRYSYIQYTFDTFAINMHRNPSPAARPTFRQVLLSLLGDDSSILAVPAEERATHSLASVLGSPLDAGHSMYLSTQHRYPTNDIQSTAM